MIRVVSVVFVLLVISVVYSGFNVCVSASTENIVVVPYDWLVGSDYVAPTFIDDGVLHNGHVSIRMERGDGSKSREIWGARPSGSTDWPAVVAGDTIVFKVYMKTSVSSISCVHALGGVRFGVDFYHDDNYITGSSCPDGEYWTVEGGYPDDLVLNYVNWGSDWSYRVMSFTVESSYPADFSGIGGYEAGEMVVPNKIIPWVQVWCGTDENLDEGVAWFSDAELYLNYPVATPTVAPTVYIPPPFPTATSVGVTVSPFEVGGWGEDTLNILFDSRVIVVGAFLLICGWLFWLVYVKAKNG